MRNFNDQHHYYTLDQHLKERFHKKVFKVSLNGNFSCPNRDGKISSNGCIFCSDKGSGDFAGNKEDSIKAQFKQISSIIHHKWPDAYYIAYFQANTNTYGPIEKLKKLFYEAINIDENVVILSIATRPDCLSIDTLNLLSELNKIKPVWVELGLQTIHQDTANLINRGYKLDVFEKAVFELRKRNIEVIVHIINGLPFETPQMMIETVKYLNTLNIQGIKIHSLYILENTELYTLYKKTNFNIMTLDEYTSVVCEQLAYLNENIVIHRISGDAPIKQLVAPLWSIKKLVVMNEIDKKMKLRGYYQGIKQKK